MNVSTPHNLLPVSRHFDGQDEAQQALFSQLSEQRVSYLTGPAGSGKTELALAAAHQAHSAGLFTDGILHLSLAGANAPSTVLGELTFHVGYDRSRSLEDAVADRNILIMWDHTDDFSTHQPGQLTELIDHLKAAPGIHHLVIGRKPMADAPGMTIPTLTGAQATALFNAHLPDSVSNRPAADDPVLVSVLERLEYNPLAVMLAAHWCQPPRWLEQLEEALRDLEAPQSGSGRLPQGLYGMLTLAFADLTDEATRLTHLLHPFPAGASGETLSALFGEEWQEAANKAIPTGLITTLGGYQAVLPAVATYLDDDANPRRREVAWEQAGVFLQQMVQECHNQANANNLAPAMRYLIKEWPNLRAAFCWVAQRSHQEGMDLEDDCALVVDFCMALFHLFTNKGMFEEGRAWMSTAKRAVDQLDHPHESALVRDYLGVFLTQTGDRELAYQQFSEAFTAFRTLKEPSGIGSAGYHLGLMEYEEGNLEAAKECFEEALPILRSVNSRGFAAQAHTYMGEILLQEGDLESAQQHFTDARELFEEGTYDPNLRIRALMGHFHSQWQVGAYAEALSSLGQAMDYGFSADVRLSMQVVPTILKIAHQILALPDSVESDRLLVQLTSEMTRVLHTRSTYPEGLTDTKGYEMALHVMQRLVHLLNLTVTSLVAATAEDDRTTARDQLVKAATELDTVTGGIMGAAEWAKVVLAKATSH